jgi:diaminohydroxyphosphoribosylaminopyrimidine deaminase/5-amino-6-(5-phosphoribosylamino)uracil reductase
VNATPRELALLEESAARARGFRLDVEPNPPVGAIVVAADGRVIASGEHRAYGGPHAEIEALAEAGERARGATLLVTLEPCTTHGKTPPCADAIAAAGIARVVFAVADPDPRHRGRAAAVLAASGIAAVGPVAPHLLETELAAFAAALRRDRPYVIAKWAMTLDGRIASATGDSRWISSEASRAFAHELRRRVDAIAVGAGTVRADRPRLTARPPGPRGALRVVFTRDGRLPEGWAALDDGGPRFAIVVAAPHDDAILRAHEAAGRRVVVATGGSDAERLLTALRELRGHGVPRLLLEGGGALLGSAFDAAAVDQVCVFVAPRVIGARDAISPVLGSGVARVDEALRLEAGRIDVLDGDVVMRGLAAASPDTRRQRTHE